MEWDFKEYESHNPFLRREWDFKGYDSYNPLFGWGAMKLRREGKRELIRSIPMYLFSSSPLLIQVG